MSSYGARGGNKNVLNNATKMRKWNNNSGAQRARGGKRVSTRWRHFHAGPNAASTWTRGPESPNVTPASHDASWRRVTPPSPTTPWSGSEASRWSCRRSPVATGPAGPGPPRAADLRLVTRQLCPLAGACERCAECFPTFSVCSRFRRSFPGGKKTRISCCRSAIKPPPGA